MPTDVLGFKLQYWNNMSYKIKTWYIMGMKVNANLLKFVMIECRAVTSISFSTYSFNSLERLFYKL